MTAAAAAPRNEPPLAELDVVRLRSAVYTDEGAVPTGSIGTIVFRHPSGEAFEVEFAEPLRTVVTLRSSDLVRSA